MDLLNERCTQTASSVSTGEAAQRRSWLASCCQGDSPFRCLSLPVQTDHGTASELLKNSSSQPVNTRSFIILKQAGACASCFQPGPFTKPVPNSSAAWRGAGIRLGHPGPSKLPSRVLGVLGELPCPRLGACALLSCSPSMAASCTGIWRGRESWYGFHQGLICLHVPTCTGQAELLSSVQWEAQLRWSGGGHCLPAPAGNRVVPAGQH